MHCILNENTLIEKISQVLTIGLLSSKKEIEASYGEHSGDDGSNTQDTSFHPLVIVSAIKFFKKKFG
jgi:hypothetical protein